MPHSGKLCRYGEKCPQFFDPSFICNDVHFENTEDATYVYKKTEMAQSHETIRVAERCPDRDNCRNAFLDRCDFFHPPEEIIKIKQSLRILERSADFTRLKVVLGESTEFNKIADIYRAQTQQLFTEKARLQQLYDTGLTTARTRFPYTSAPETPLEAPRTHRFDDTLTLRAIDRLLQDTTQKIDRSDLDNDCLLDQGFKTHWDFGCKYHPWTSSYSYGLKDFPISSIEVTHIPEDFLFSHVSSITHAFPFNWSQTRHYILENNQDEQTLLMRLHTAIYEAWLPDSSFMRMRDFVCGGALGHLFGPAENFLNGLEPIPPPDALHTLGSILSSGFTTKERLARLQKHSMQINYTHFPLPLFIEKGTGRIWAFAFHGTESSGAVMAKGLFRTTFPQKAHGRMYGDGVYFTTHSCKAHQYTARLDAAPSSEVKRNSRILFCAICLGRNPEFSFHTGGKSAHQFSSLVALPGVANEGKQAHSEFVVSEGTHLVLFQIELRNKGTFERFFER